MYKNTYRRKRRYSNLKSVGFFWLGAREKFPGFLLNFIFPVMFLLYDFLKRLQVLKFYKMKKALVLLTVALLGLSVAASAQDKNQKGTQKTTTQAVTKQADKPAQGDKTVPGKKGPNGETVYQGTQGGLYYINAAGNKTYLKDTDPVVQGKKGPNGEVVYAGPKGGQYYLNKSGEKVYLK